MTPIANSLGAALLGILIFASSGAQSQITQPNQTDLEDILNAIELVQSKIQRTQREKSAAAKELTRIEKSIVNLNQQAYEIEELIRADEKQLTALQLKTTTLQRSKLAQQAHIEQYIKNVHQAGRTEYIKLLLNQQDPKLTSRSLKYYEYFQAARQKKVSAYNSTIHDLNEAERQTQASTDRLSTNRHQLELEKITLSNSQDERQVLITKLTATLGNSDTELINLETDKSEMELLLTELASSFAERSLSSQPFVKYKGALPWPSPGPIIRSNSSNLKQSSLSEGVTITGNQGEPIKAIHYGRVVFAEWFSNSGLLLIIDHGDGYMSLYAHNQLLYKEVGNWVSPGETIAALGNTGGRGQDGVYFEVRHNGISQNPYNWCIARN